METKSYSQFGMKFWIILASFVIVVSGMKIASDLIIPLFLSLFITAICYGPFLWLQKKGLPQAAALVVVLLSIGVISFIVVALLGTSIAGFSEKLPFYEERFAQYWIDINQWLVQIGWMDKDIGLIENIKPGNIMTIAGGVFTGFSSLMSDSFIIILVVIFMLLEISVFIEKMKIIDPRSLSRIDDIVKNLNKYFGTKTVTSLSTGILVTISLSIIGVDFPILWGSLAFLLNFIPNIGSIIAAIPAVLLALVQLGPGSALTTALVYLAINSIIGNLIEPRLMGKTLGLSPLVVLLSLIIWGWVLGTVGMLLATPLTITIKIIFDSMDETKSIGLMLGNENSLKQYKN